MPTVLHKDAFSATLLESPALAVTDEQKSLIKEILDIACSDSRFAEKAYLAIHRVLTGGIASIPTITSLTPSSVVLGSPSFDLHVIGTGFTSSSIIVFNGSEEPTTYASATELTTGVDMSTAVTPIVVPVAVLNDGVMSDSMDFAFTEQVVVMSASTVQSKTSGTKSEPVKSSQKGESTLSNEQKAKEIVITDKNDK